MVKISLCMIVKNEEKHLDTCLGCLKDICDEMIIVDTGSTDRTKEIAAGYTDRIYDFKWIDDFSAARNFAFEKATGDYIYSADADEFIDPENIQKFKDLKEAILPEIEIVQFIYVENGIRTVLDDSEELRPKLYKRNRSFTWIDPVHETVRTLPLVYDCDIRIEHRPDSLHANRDFSLIERAYRNNGRLSQNLYEMYAREVYKWGDEKDLKAASDIFAEVMENEETGQELYIKLCAVNAKSALKSKDLAGLLKYTTKSLALGGCSEICCLLGDYFTEHNDPKEAELWYYNAINEFTSVLDSGMSGSYPEACINTINENNPRG